MVLPAGPTKWSYQRSYQDLRGVIKIKPSLALATAKNEVTDHNHTNGLNEVDVGSCEVVHSLGK